MGFLAALRFLTVLPMPSRPMERLTFSAAYFPLVGLLLGGILVGVDWGLSFLLPRPLINGALIVALILLTGGLHLDGFMDTLDALPGSHSQQRRLEILRDVRVGSFGILGLVSLLMLKYLALGALPLSLRATSLLLMPVLSRWAMALAILAFPAARPEGVGRGFKEAITWQGVCLASTVALAASSLALGVRGVGTMAGAGLLAMLLGWHLSRRLSGLTGDTYGAINEVVEVAVLIVVPLAAGAYGLEGRT